MSRIIFDEIVFPDYVFIANDDNWDFLGNEIYLFFYCGDDENPWQYRSLNWGGLRLLLEDEGDERHWILGQPYPGGGLSVYYWSQSINTETPVGFYETFYPPYFETVGETIEFPFSSFPLLAVYGDFEGLIFGYDKWSFWYTHDRWELIDFFEAQNWYYLNDKWVVIDKDGNVWVADGGGKPYNFVQVPSPGDEGYDPDDPDNPWNWDPSPDNPPSPPPFPPEPPIPPPTRKKIIII